MTTTEYLHLWIDAYVKPFRAENTRKCYMRAMNSLPPEILNSELAQLEPIRLQLALNRQAEKYPRAAQLTYATLHTAFERAVKLRYLANNPIDACEKPVHVAKRATVLSPVQLHAYLAAARQTDVWPLLLLMATCALRRSEALGSRRTDFCGGMMDVQRQRIRTTGRYDVAPLKSRASRRVIPIPADVQREVDAWPIRCLGGWLVDTTPEHLHAVHRRIVASLALPPITLHGLRHSCATALAESGTPMKLLQALLGHSHYQLTADLYADHVRGCAYADDVANLARKVL